VGVRVEPGDKGTARGDADGGRAVGTFETKPTVGKAIDVRRVDLAVAIAARGAALMLVRHEKQEVVSGRGQKGGSGEEGSAGNHYTHATKDL